MRWIIEVSRSGIGVYRQDEPPMRVAPPAREPRPREARLQMGLEGIASGHVPQHEAREHAKRTLRAPEQTPLQALFEPTRGQAG